MAAPAGATNNPLFRFGVDLDGVAAQTGRTALHSAAMFADADKVRRLVVDRAHILKLSSSATLLCTSVRVGYRQGMASI